MKTLGVALVGAGFMGRRHLLGYAALKAAGYERITVEAILDLDPEVATSRADEAERLLGTRPRVHTDLATMLEEDDAVDAVDIVTDPRTHHTIANAAMEAGRHVICEKPLALTVRTASSMVRTAERTGTVLATAENYRRGGSNRLAKAVIDSGLLGELYLFRELRVGGDDGIIISPWRHMKRSGSIGLDMPIHYADIVEYLLGPVESVWGRGFIAEPTRVGPEGRAIVPDGDDSLVVAMRTASGVDVHLAYIPSGRGPAYSERVLHGRNGSLEIPADRTDGDVVLHLPDGSHRGREIIALLGDRFRLDPVTAAVLGSDGTGGKGAPWADVDAGHLAIELADFADAVLDGHQAEVDGMGGLRPLAVVHAGFESGVLGRAVRVEDVLDGSLHSYQDDIDAQFSPAVTP